MIRFFTILCWLKRKHTILGCKLIYIIYINIYIMYIIIHIYKICHVDYIVCILQSIIFCPLGLERCVKYLNIILYLYISFYISCSFCLITVIFGIFTGFTSSLWFVNLRIINYLSSPIFHIGTPLTLCICHSKYLAVSLMCH